MQLTNYTIYTTPTCHYCGILKSWLSENSIAFETKDVAADLAARSEMVEKSQQLGVPVSVLRFEGNGEIVEKVVIGYDQPRLAELLHIGA